MAEDPRLAAYERRNAATRPRRLRWWREARYGMFVHWGLYSQLGRHEWVMNRERIPLADYERLSDAWHPTPGAPRAWARLAKAAGMRYLVMTTKHHEGFSLWDSDVNPYNAARRGPGRDLVREFVDACRAEGLRVGLYYSLMDWHHPDGFRCMKNKAARRRFVDYTHACVREICANYGRSDILWYDTPIPLGSAEAWESLRLNGMVRDLQPDILINNRAALPEDFGTPEGHLTPEKDGRAWESCFTTNDAWGYMPCPPEDWRTPRQVIEWIRTVAAGGGNLLLNIGPRADGSVPEEGEDLLRTVGRWLRRNGEAVYGFTDRAQMEWMAWGHWTVSGRTAYCWCTRWPGTTACLGGLKCRVKRVTLLDGGRPVRFRQTRTRLLLSGLPARCPDRVARVAVLKIECDRRPKQFLGFAHESD